MRIPTFVDDEEEFAGLLVTLAVIGVFAWYHTGNLTLLSQLATIGLSLVCGAVAGVLTLGVIHRVQRWRA
jgi:uncharacterized membrane protein